MQSLLRLTETLQQKGRLVIPRSTIRHPLALCLLLAVPAISGCRQDQDITDATAKFQASSATFTAAFATMLNNANNIEAEHYINTQAVEAGPITPAAIQSRALLTPEEIALRIAAIQALADYTTALATLASGASEAQVQTDFTTASTSLGTLSTDAAAAFAHPSSTSTQFNYATPVSAAVAAMGNIIDLVLRHRNRTTIRRSIFENDATLNRLYDLIARESTYLYAREKSNVGSTGVGIQAGYDKLRLAPSPNAADLLQMADRYKQWQKDSVAVAGADPTTAIAAFKKCHDKLIDTLLSTKSVKKDSLADLIADVKAFAADVTPLADNLKTLASSF